MQYAGAATVQVDLRAWNSRRTVAPSTGTRYAFFALRLSYAVVMLL